IPLTLTLLSCEKFVESFKFSSLGYLESLAVSVEDEVSPEEVSMLNLENCTSLTVLSCDEIRLKSLNLSGCVNLGNIYCSKNQLVELDLSSNIALTNLLCDGNQLGALDLSENTALTNLVCYGNQLDALDITMLPNLAELECGAQTEADGTTAKTVTLTLTAAQMTTWTNDWGKNQNENKNVTPTPTSTPNIPDAALAGFLLKEGYVTQDGINYVATQKGLDLNFLMISTDPEEEGDPALVDVKNVAGLEIFTSLTHLYVDGVNVTSIDVSKNANLIMLKVDGCPELASVVVADFVESENGNGLMFEKLPRLTSISYLGTAPLSVNLTDCSSFVSSFDFSSLKGLAHLQLTSCGITSFDLSNCASLRSFACLNQGLTDLRLGKIDLEKLNCSGNELTSLDLSGNTKLTTLDCSFNQLFALDIRHIEALEYLAAGNQSDNSGDEKRLFLALTNEQYTTKWPIWVLDKNYNVTPDVRTK
ncbi:MAG: hypothetical protein ACRCZZ_03620, partial [Phocaeicola sp.]